MASQATSPGQLALLRYNAYPLGACCTLQRGQNGVIALL
jgi:hypothetical protein